MNAKIQTLENSVEAIFTEHQLELFSPMSQEINETLEIHNIRLAIKIGRKGFEAMVKIPSYFLRSSAGISYGEECRASEHRPSLQRSDFRTVTDVSLKRTPVPHTSLEGLGERPQTKNCRAVKNVRRNHCPDKRPDERPNC